MMMIYFVHIVSLKYYDGFEVFHRIQYPYTRFQRGIITQNICWVMVPIFCTSSDDALYLYQVL